MCKKCLFHDVKDGEKEKNDHQWGNVDIILTRTLEKCYVTSLKLSGH